MQPKRRSSLSSAATQKLQKVLAGTGLGSRRSMEELIKSGKVRVNGALAQLGDRVGPGDVIRVGRRTIEVEEEFRLPRILLYHKPEGEIVTRNDPQGRPSVFLQLPRLRAAQWLAVGRLDYNTSGLLIFTTSGELVNRLTHPRFEVEREYAVRIMGKLSEQEIGRLTRGIELADGDARFESLLDEGGEGSNHWYRAVLTEGRNRIVRRMFEQAGYTVSRLIRIRFGIVGLPPQLRRGQCVELREGAVKQILAWVDMLPTTPPPVSQGRPATHGRPRRAKAAR